jgi:hypothetical protein
MPTSRPYIGRYARRKLAGAGHSRYCLALMMKLKSDLNLESRAKLWQSMQL